MYLNIFKEKVQVIWLKNNKYLYNRERIWFKEHTLGPVLVTVSVGRLLPRGNNSLLRTLK
jgi:hypothetical protein